MGRTLSRYARLLLACLAGAALLTMGASSLPAPAAAPDLPGQAAFTRLTAPRSTVTGSLPTFSLRSWADVGVQAQLEAGRNLVPLVPKTAGGTSRRRPAAALLVGLRRSLAATSRPGGERVVGVVSAGSKYYRFPITAWVLQVSSNGRFGRVPIPYTARPRTGWIPLRGLKRSHTPYAVYADLSAHRLTVRKWGRVILRVPMATGARWSPTPPGRYFVTDRVPFNPSGALGAFAFGISGIQPRLPAGWHGGNQLAIHGTNNPSSIGRSASAGCLRVARAVLERLKLILVLGTPVVIQP